jgi:hypothetical protein
MQFTYMQTQTADMPCGEMWTTGRFDADGGWHPESDWSTADEAAGRAAALNGDGDDGATMRPRAGHTVPDAFVQDMR